MAIGVAIGNFFPPAAISSIFPVELLIFLWQLDYPDDVSTISKVKIRTNGQVFKDTKVLGASYS
jgi:hypothetical protein